MPEISDAYLIELTNAGEIELSTDVPCIWNRFSLSVTKDDPTYSLPTGILTIKDVRWKGEKVWPWSQKMAYELGYNIDPFNPTTGKPFFYITGDYGYGKITFYPAPNETLTANDSQIYQREGIESQLIITCYRVADPSGDTYRLPTYLRRRINKYYVNYRKYMKEGQGQDTDVSDYFKQRFDAAKTHLHSVVNSVPKCITPMMVPQTPIFAEPPRAVLPSNFGIVVE